MMYLMLVFFFKQKTAYDVLISDWSSDVCSSGLGAGDSVTNVQLRGLPSSMTGVTLDGDSLPGANASGGAGSSRAVSFEGLSLAGIDSIDRKSTRLNSSH